MESEKQHAIDLSLDLTSEEIFVIAEMLQIPQIMGIDFAELRELPEAVQNAISATARRGLQARQFIHQNGQQAWEPTPFVASLILTCTAPQTSFIILQQRAGTPPVPRFAHSVAGETVIMYPLDTGIYRFVLSQQENPQMQMGLAALALEDKPVVDAQSFTVTQEIIDQVRTQLSQNQQAEAVQTLINQSVEQNAAKAFVAALANTEVTTTMTQLFHASETQPSSASGFTVLDSPQGIWLLQPEDGIITIAPARQAQVIAELSKLVA